MKTSTSYADAVDVRKRNLAMILSAMERAACQTVGAKFDSIEPSNITLTGKCPLSVYTVACEYHPLTVDHIHDGSVLVKYHEQPNTLTLREAIEAWCMQLLEDRHRGWHKGAGCYGTFTFSEPDECVTLDLNQRIVRSKTEIYEP